MERRERERAQAEENERVGQERTRGSGVGTAKEGARIGFARIERENVGADRAKDVWRTVRRWWSAMRVVGRGRGRKRCGWTERRCRADRRES